MLNKLKKKISNLFEGIKDIFELTIFVYFTKEYVSCIFADKTNIKNFFFLLSHYILLISFIIAIISAFICTMCPKNVFFQGVLFFSGLIFGLFFILVLPYSLFYSWNLYYKSCYAIFQNPQLIQKTEHVGIIFPHYKENTKEICIGDSIALLVTRLLENNISYCVYHCFSIKDFSNIYTNPNITILWIFGHGKRNLLSLGKDPSGQVINIEYEKLPYAKPKKFITQLHCNTGKGKSLAEINGAQNSCVSQYSRDLIQNRCYILHYNFDAY